MPHGKFITLEGGEGSGKSTQAKLLAGRLQDRHFDVVLTREPGGTPFAEQVRTLLLGPDLSPHDALAEALLFYAARADHLARVIRPALKAGKWVICDRFSDSTRVYQSLAGGLSHDTFVALERLIVAPTTPHLTCIMSIPAEEGLRRAEARRQAATPDGADRYEARTLQFHRRLRDGFLKVAADDPGRCIVIDAMGERAQVAERVWAAVTERLLTGDG